MKDLISKKELMERWSCSNNSLAKIESEGFLKRCPHVGGEVKYRMEDVLKCEGADHYDPMSPFERRKLLDEIKRKDEIIRQCKDRIRTVTASFLELNAEMEKTV